MRTSQGRGCICSVASEERGNCCWNSLTLNNQMPTFLPSSGCLIIIETSTRTISLQGACQTVPALFSSITGRGKKVEGEAPRCMQVKRTPFSLLPETDICWQQPFVLILRFSQLTNLPSKPVIWCIRLIFITCGRESRLLTHSWSNFWSVRRGLQIIVPQEVFVFFDLLQRAFASALFLMESLFRPLNLDSAVSGNLRFEQPIMPRTCPHTRKGRAFFGEMLAGDA